MVFFGWSNNKISRTGCLLCLSPQFCQPVQKKKKVFPTGWWFTSCSGWHVENLHLFPNHLTCKQWLFMLSYDIYYSVWKSCWGTGWQTILGYKSHGLQPQVSLYTNHINSDLVLSSFLILKFDTVSTQSLSSNLGTTHNYLFGFLMCGQIRKPKR